MPVYYHKMIRLTLYLLLLGAIPLSRAQFSLSGLGPTPKFRFSFDTTNSAFFIEHVGDSSGYYRFNGMNFNTMALSVHFYPGPGSVLIEPDVSLVQIQSNPALVITGNKVNYNAGGPEWAWGSPINSLGGVRSFYITTEGQTCIGICNQATVDSVFCTDMCPYQPWIQTGNLGYPYANYPCDSTCSSGNCYGPAPNLCCHASCKTCWGPSSTVCSECTAGNFLQPSSTTCSNSCPTGYWGNSATKTCDACHTYCAACTGATSTQCSSCKTGYFKQPAPNANTCASTCPSGYYKNTGTNTCSSCNVACATCTGSANSVCPTCNAGYFLQPSSTTCLNSCPATGYWKNSGTKTCDVCHSYCKICTGSNSNQCSSCNDGYFKQPVPNANTCSSTCPAGYYKDTSSNICGACDTACATCTGSSNSVCPTCKNGYYLQPSSTTCLTTCPSTSYWLNSGTHTCDPCHSYCQICTGAASNQCSSCKNNYYLQPPSNPNTCSPTCPAGYYQDTSSNSCSACNTACTTCTGPTNTDCPSCNNNYYLQPSSTTCLTTCPSTGYWPNSGTHTCDSCHSACLTCSGSANTECSTCSTNNYLQPAPNANTCESTCPDGYFPNSTTNLCDACNGACATCTGPTDTECPSCNSGYYLQPYSTICLTTCPTTPQYWLNTNGNICSFCQLISGGNVSVNPSIGGIPLSTSFSLSIQGWTPKNGGSSLLYLVSYSINGSIENAVLISDFSSVTQSSFYLPNTSYVTIIVTIKEVPSGCLTNISTQVSLSTQSASFETALSTTTTFAKTVLSEVSTSSINILAGQISLIDSQLAGSSSENGNCSLSVTVQCSNHGICNTNRSMCECYEGYYLADCSMTEEEYNQQLEYRQILVNFASSALLNASSSADINTINSVLHLMNVLTQDPFLNNNATLPTALDSVKTSISMLKSLSSGDNLTTAIENMVGILSNVQNQISASDCAMATTFSSEATNQTYQYLDELSNLILQDLSVGQENVIKTSNLILYSASVDTNNLTNFTIAPDSAVPKITFGDTSGQNIASSSVAITYIYSKSKDGCTNNPKRDFVIEVKDGSSLQPLQNLKIPINVFYDVSVFGNIRCPEPECQETKDAGGNTVCSCNDISIFDVKSQLAKIYQNSQLRYLTINNLLDIFRNPPYTKWSFWVIIGYSIGLIVTWIIVNTINKNYCIIAKTRERRKTQKYKNFNFCKTACFIFLMAHPLVGIFVYKDRAISKSFRALLYFQRAMIILAYSAVFASDPSFKVVSISP